MKLRGKLLEKLIDAGIEIEEVEKKIILEDDSTGTEKIDVGKFPCGRDFIILQFNEEIKNSEYLASNFEYYKFIKDFEAVWSPKLKVIECEIEPVNRSFAPSSYLLRKLGRVLGEEIADIEENVRFNLEKSEHGIQVSLGNASLDYSILTFLKDRRGRFEFNRRRSTIRIENIDISTHDQAKKSLEKIGNSVLFKFDLTINTGLKLVEDREIRRTYFRRKRLSSELDKTFPTYEYDTEPMSLYWYARSAFDMPLLQFLSFYQILEFYFPVFSQKDAHQQIKNIIKDPRFNPNKDTEITRLLTTISQNKSQLGFGTELEQLKSTIANCITSEELKKLIESDENMLSFFKDKKSKSLASKNLSLTNGGTDLVNECAERIYEIRCRVVHTKASDKNYELLLPSSPELKHLVFDITILESIAKKVLVSTSRLLKI